jgi:phage terminase Nu1 subunit (DNA packaging protein)
MPEIGHEPDPSQAREIGAGKTRAERAEEEDAGDEPAESAEELRAAKAKAVADRLRQNLKQWPCP